MAFEAYPVKLRQNLITFFGSRIHLSSNLDQSIAANQEFHRQGRLDPKMAAVEPRDILILKLCSSEHSSASASTVK